MLQRVGQIGISVLLCFFMRVSEAQTPGQQYKVINWHPEVPYNIYTVFPMIRDSLGFLWLTSPDGLWRFDGSSVKSYHSTDRYKTIIGKQTLGLVEDSLHNIWIGSDSGLIRYDIRADSFQTFHMLKKTISGNNYFIPFHATRDEVWSIDSDTTILAINIYTCKKRILFTNVPPAFYYPKFTYTFYDKASNSIWYLGGRGLLLFSLNDGKTHTSLEGDKSNLLAKKTGLVILNDTARHCVWLVQNDLYQLNLSEKNIKHFKTFNGIAYSPASALALDRQNRLWIGTRANGIFIYEPEKNSFQQFVREQGSPNAIQSNMIRSIYCDRDGMIWVGAGKGVDQITTNTAIQHYTDYTENGNDLSSGNVRTFAQAKGGKIWMGGWDGPIDVFDPATGNFEHFAKKGFPDLPINHIRLIRIDTISNKVWISADYEPGELDLRTKKFKRIVFRDLDGKTVDPTTVISQHWEALNDSVWILGTWHGLYTFKKGADTAYKLPFLSNKNIQSIAKGNNTFFFNSIDLFPAAYSYIDGKWDSLGKVFNNIPVRSIVWDENDKSWWVGSSTGLYHMNSNLKTIRHYTIDNGLSDNTISSIVKDKKGLFWLGTGKGICLFDPQKEYFNNVGAAYGCTDAYFPRAFFLASNGDVYLGGGDGFDRIQPDLVNLHFPPAKIYFKSLSIDKLIWGNSININRIEALSLKYFQNDIDIETGVIDFYSRGTNQIRYKLGSESKDWQYGGANHRIHYGSLPPGKYEFIMEASNANNEWPGPVKKIKFIINPPFWITWWFRILCILSIAAIVYSIYKYRVTQLKKLFTIRTRISQDLHDEIGSTLSSINILSKVSLSILEKDKTRLPGILQKISNQSENVQQSMSDIVWSIQPDNDKLENLIIRMREYLGHSAEARDMTVEFFVQEHILKESIPIQNRQNIFLIFKEAVNNAVKYSSGKKIAISLDKKNNEIKLSVQDDGVGFQPDKIAGSNGLKNMHDRARAMHGTLRIHSVPDQGTEVELICPST